MHCVFHGIRFKVRGLVVGRQLIFFYALIFHFLSLSLQQGSPLINRTPYGFIMTQPEEKKSILYRTWRLYADGFRDMTIGRYLWALILVKLAIFFLVFKLIFFPDLLDTRYDNDDDRAQAVRENLINGHEK